MRDAFNKLTKKTTERKATSFNYNAKAIVNGDSIATDDILHVSEVKKRKKRGSGCSKMEIKMTENKKIVIDEQYQNRRFIYHFFKRAIDIIASGAGLIWLSPLFLIISLAIKAEDRGPIFYSQIRLGKGQRPFKMYKFRSMIVDADKKLEDLLEKNEVDGAMKHDPELLGWGGSRANTVWMNSPNCGTYWLVT